MAAFWISRNRLITILREAAGYKSGLALSADDLRHATPPDLLYLVEREDEKSLRIRAEEFDDLFAQILYQLGASDIADGTPADFRLLSKYHDTDERDLFLAVETVWMNFVLREMTKDLPRGAVNDPTEMIRLVLKKHGSRGAELLLEMIEGVQKDIERNFWNRMRRTDWKDTRDLRELFKSEKLDSLHGKFFDQRFIDFLHANFSRIDQIHWRQFEGLTCEFFEREGFHVEIGPGRNDGGVDARIWSTKNDPTVPPLIVVQCKRQHQKIGKTVVKALYADVLHERANSGLIVTTSELAPGSSHMKSARSYPVEEADRETLKSWITAMRTAASGTK